MKFNVGDKVRVKEVEYNGTLPSGWTDKMLDFMGEEGVIEFVNSKFTLVRFKHNSKSWYYKEEDLELVDDSDLEKKIKALEAKVEELTKELEQYKHGR